MAIIREYYGKGLNDIDLYRTYSDEEFMIRKKGTNELYEDAIDSEYYKYEETDIKIKEIIEPSNTEVVDMEKY